MRKPHILLPKVNRRKQSARRVRQCARDRKQQLAPDTVMCHRRLEGESKQGMADEMRRVPDTGFI